MCFFSNKRKNWRFGKIWQKWVGKRFLLINPYEAMLITLLYLFLLDMLMSEQVEEPKKSENVNEDYLKGYRAGWKKGYERALKKAKKSSLEIEVQKENPIKKEEQPKEPKKEEQPKEPKKEDNSRITIVTGIIVALVLGLVIYFVIRGRNKQPNE